MGCLALVAVTLSACQSSIDDRTLRACLVGEGLLAEGRADEAIELFEQARARDPDLPANHLVLAAAWSHKDQPTQVEENLRAYLVLNPKHTAARLYLAEVLRRQSRFDEAWTQYVAFLTSEQRPDAKSCQRRGHALRRMAELAKDHRPGQEPLILALQSYDQALTELAHSNGSPSGEQRPVIEAHLAAAVEHLQSASPLKSEQTVVDRIRSDASDLAQRVGAGESIAWETVPWPARHMVPSTNVLPWTSVAKSTATAPR